MKKLLFICFITALTSGRVASQIIKKSVPAVKQNMILKTDPNPPPPATTNKTAAASNQNAPVYSLTAVRVNIKTGNDNKEFPSNVDVSLWKKDHQGWNYPNDCYYKTPSLKNEMAVKSNTDLGLDKYAGNADKFDLVNLQTSGLDLVVEYQPNFFMDAWKIENISLTLEFKDQNGNLHPTMGNKTISFSNAIGFLNAEYHKMKCKTDQNFDPLTASIEK